MFSGNRPWRRALLKTFNVELEDIQSIGEQLEFDKNSANENPEVPNLNEYNNRLLSSIREVWKELHSWGKDLQLLLFYLTIQIHPLAEQVEGWAYMIPRIPYIHLIDDENQLPALQSVQEFRLYADGSRIFPTSLMALVKTMPNVQSVDLEFDDCEKRDIDWRKEVRNDFAESIDTLSLTPQKIKSAEIRLRYVPVRNETKTPWRLADDNGDRVSRSIRTLSMTLTNLTIEGEQFSTEIFWPTRSEDKAPEWPHLEHFVVRTSQETADGKYYLLAGDGRFPFIEKEPPSEIRDEETLELVLENNPDLVIEHEMGLFPYYPFRLRPDHDLFNNLALAIAHAGQRMPKLNVLSFQVLKDFGRFDKSYGFHFFSGKGNCPPRTDWVFKCPYGQLLGWHPPEEARNLWKAKCEGYLEESIISDEYDLDVQLGYVRHFPDGRQVSQRFLGRHFDIRGVDLYLE